MIHKELFYGCLTAMAVALPLSSCSEEESAVAAPGRDVKLTVTLNRDANDTRSILSEDDDHNLVCNWENDDYILVTDANGNKLGVLANQSKTGSTTETFSGIITTTLSGDTPLNFLYLGRMSEEELLNTGNPLTIDYSSQDGTIDWISANDFFSKTAKVNISGSVAKIGNLSLERQISFGHFCITLPGEASYSGEDITISGPGIYTQASVNAQGGVTFSNADNSDNGAITITSGSPDFYVTILPKEGVAITPTFSVTIGGKQYAATLDPRTWAPSEFVRGDDGNAMTVKLEAVPEPADDTVGPTFEIDGKKYRLTKGNLYYDTKTKKWGIFENQTDMLQQQGCTYEKTSTTSSPEIIDLFSWGATGLGNARTPELFAAGWANETSYSSANFPSTNTATMDTQGNANILDLWLFDRQYDFGYAYMQTAKKQGDNRDYRTPPLEYFEELCKQDYSFSQGCTISKAAPGNKDLKGALIIPGITTVEEATEKITSVGGKVSGLTKLTPNKNNTGFNFSCITLSSIEMVEEMGAIFLPAVGEGTFISGTKTGPAKPGLADNCGAYWSKDGSKGSSTQANAYRLYFRWSSSSNKEFNWKESTSGVSIKRNARSAVRLLVEVK